MHKQVILLLFVLAIGCSKDDPSNTCTQTISPTVWTSLDQDQLALDIAAIDLYIVDHPSTATAIEDVSGIRYRITEEDPAATETPCIESSVTVKYTGLLFNGNQFDENLVGITFPLKNLIAGWKIALLKFKKGTKATLYIPSGLAYGTTARSGIPANSNLIFFVELVDFK